MEKTYVEQRDGGYWITATRISLDSIVYAFKRGAAPESIHRAFPLLTLEEVYGAITFYLAHESQIDAYLGQSEVLFEGQSNALTLPRGRRTLYCSNSLSKRVGTARRPTDEGPLSG